jgi:hypothetical protein
MNNAHGRAKTKVVAQFTLLAMAWGSSFLFIKVSSANLVSTAISAALLV